jgi:hypothetical protein
MTPAPPQLGAPNPVRGLLGLGAGLCDRRCRGNLALEAAVARVGLSPWHLWWLRGLAPGLHVHRGASSPRLARTGPGPRLQPEPA